MLVKAYTDGSLLASKFGGWAFNCYDSDKNPIAVGAGWEKGVTSNQMEIAAALLAATAALYAGAKLVQIHSDSQYVVNTLDQYLDKYMENGWKTATGHDVKNSSYWKTFQVVRSRIKVMAIWKPRNTVPQQAWCDAAAKAEAELSKSSRWDAQTLVKIRGKKQYKNTVPTTNFLLDTDSNFAKRWNKIHG